MKIQTVAATEIEIEYQTPEGEYEYINVIFYGDILKQNSGIGGYEYWGAKGYDAGFDYYECDGIGWDKDKHTESENNIIEKYLNDNFDSIEEAIIDEHKNDY